MQNVQVPAGQSEKADSAITPRHYTELTPEPIEVIEGWGLGFCVGNAIKYLARAGRKSPDAREDLAKAVWYISREIERLSQGKKA